MRAFFPIEAGEMVRGRQQKIYFVEYGRPLARTVLAVQVGINDIDGVLLHQPLTTVREFRGELGSKLGQIPYPAHSKPRVGVTANHAVHRTGETRILPASGAARRACAPARRTVG